MAPSIDALKGRGDEPFGLVGDRGRLEKELDLERRAGRARDRGKQIVALASELVGIALDVSGYISEGSGENVFLIKDGVVMTPPLYSTILPGITRDSVIKICESIGIPVLERAIPREMLYIADEVFFTGTAAEITPIRSVDKVIVGAGRRGPLTEEIQRRFFAIITGESEDEFGWLTPVEAPKVAATTEPQLA